MRQGTSSTLGIRRECWARSSCRTSLGDQSADESTAQGSRLRPKLVPRSRQRSDLRKEPRRIQRVLAKYDANRVHAGATDEAPLPAPPRFGLLLRRPWPVDRSDIDRGMRL